MKKRLFSALAVCGLAVGSSILLSSFVFDPVGTGGDMADESSSGGRCYSTSIYACGSEISDGFGVTCSFTGVYGSPYDCSSVTCNGSYSSRRCVLKKAD